MINPLVTIRLHLMDHIQEDDYPSHHVVEALAIVTDMLHEQGHQFVLTPHAGMRVYFDGGRKEGVLTSFIDDGKYAVFFDGEELWDVEDYEYVNSQ